MTPATPSIVFFDLDDTLLDHKGAETRALSAIHGAYGLFDGLPQQDWIDAYKRRNKALWQAYSQGHLSRHELHASRFRDTLEELGLPSDDYEAMGKDYMEHYRHHWAWLPGAQSVYERIASVMPVGILTNGFRETQRLKLDRFGLWNSASRVVISEEVGVMKPHPRIFSHAQGELASGDVFYVGDSLESDIIGGSAAGWRTAWYCPDGEGAETASPAELVFDRFDTLLTWLRLEG